VPRACAAVIQITGGTASRRYGRASKTSEGGVLMLKRTLTAIVLVAVSSLAASAREPVVVKARASADKDQSRLVSDASLKPQKFVDYIGSEQP
jgi:hypothetical protein